MPEGPDVAPDAADVLADVARRRGSVSDDQRFVAAHDPAFLAAYEAIYDAALGDDGGVPVRVKEFVAIGILLTRGASDAGIERHMRRAIEHGATTRELFAVVRTMLVPGGAPVYNRGVALLRRVVQGSAPG